MKKSAISSSVINYLLMVACAIISFDISAHPGHDHSHWMSGLYHTLGFIAIVISLLIAFYCLLKAYNMQSKKLQEKR